MFWIVLFTHTVWLTLAVGQMYTKEPIEPWRYFMAVLTCTIWAVPSAFETFGGYTMQVKIKQEQQVFKPVTIEITFESKDELTLMNEMLSYDISVPELVFEQDEDLQQKLTELMAKIDRVIVESLKGFE